MADFSQLKSYLSENKTTATSSGSSHSIAMSNLGASTSSLLTKSTSSLNEAKDSFMGLFGGGNRSSRTPPTNLDNEQTEGWFREADIDPFCPKLSRTQRIIGFMICLLMGAFCMLLSSFYIPVIVLKSRKFVLLFSLGSLFFLASFSLLWGVKNHLKHLLNMSRLPFTLAYFFTLFATIYYALIIKSVLITLIFAVLQIATLVWYIISYLPGGQTGLKFFAKLFYSLASKTVQTTLQV